MVGNIGIDYQSYGPGRGLDWSVSQWVSKRKLAVPRDAIRRCIRHVDRLSISTKSIKRRYTCTAKG